MDTKTYDDQMADILSRWHGLRSALVEPFRKDDGSISVPSSHREQESMAATLNNAIKGTIFEEMGNGGSQVAAEWAKSLAVYERKYGSEPSPDILAAAHRAAENVVKQSNDIKRHWLLGGIDRSTSDSIIMRDRLLSLILPVYLSMVTSNMVTYIPANFYQSEFICIKRMAGSTFGDLQKGDVIDYNYKGLYTIMDQRVELATGDGSTTSFAFDSKTKYGTVYPFKPKRTVIEMDGVEVARDSGDGTISRVCKIDDVQYTIAGTVTNAEGKMEIAITPAPAAGSKVALAFDVDIEREPDLIPRLDYSIKTHTMYSHESAVYVDSMNSMSTESLRDALAADKDRKHLHDMYRHVTQTVECERTRPEGISPREQYKIVRQALRVVDAMLKQGTGVAGLSGLVAGIRVINLLRYLFAPYFDPAPDYRYAAQPHYVGRLWKSIELYCDPRAEDEWSCLCYARGEEYGQTAYIAGDAVPVQYFKPSDQNNLKRKCLYELAYRAM